MWYLSYNEISSILRFAKSLGVLYFLNISPVTLFTLTSVHWADNIVATNSSNAFNQDAMAVDTHVFRVSNRIGIVNTQTPEKTEFALMDAIPKKRWSHSHHLFVYSYICALSR